MITNYVKLTLKSCDPNTREIAAIQIGKIEINFIVYAFNQVDKKSVKSANDSEAQEQLY